MFQEIIEIDSTVYCFFVAEILYVVCNRFKLDFVDYIVSVQINLNIDYE
jgi:hypothetical protein